MNTALLHNLSVLVTRPAEKSANMCALLAAYAAHPIAFPTIEITPIVEQHPDFGQLKQTIMNLDLFDIIICVSANAARLAGELIDQYWPQLPINIQWFAIGEQTANILAQFDIQARVATGSQDSESLLADPALQQILASKVLILKGHAGRALLGETLASRGAIVTEVPLYNRLIPVYTDQYINSILYKSSLSAILITSGEALQNLTAMARNSLNQFSQNSLFATDLIVPSARVAEIAATQQYQRITVAAAADDQSMLVALLSVKGLEADNEKTK